MLIVIFLPPSPEASNVETSTTMIVISLLAGFLIIPQHGKVRV